MTKSSALEMIDAFVAALGAHDIDRLRSLCHPDCVWWLNLTDADAHISSLFEALEVERQHVLSITIRERSRLVGPNGFAVQIDGEGTTRGGQEFRVPICFVVTTQEARITRIDEYSSERQARPLLAEIFGA